MPEDNKIEIEGGRVIEYGDLVLATGLGQDFDSITGLR